jgi:DNA-binding transcriptional LysR family regulator
MVRDSGTLRSRSGGWLNERRWTVSNKATSIRAACMGLGYAWYPEENIREELDAGRIPDTLGSTDKALGSNWRPGSTSDGGGTASGGLT